MDFKREKTKTFLIKVQFYYNIDIILGALCNFFMFYNIIMKNLLFDIDDMVVYKGVKLELSVSNIYNYIKNEIDIIEYLESEILPIRRNNLLDKLLMN